MLYILLILLYSYLYIIMICVGIIEHFQQTSGVLGAGNSFFNYFNQREGSFPFPHEYCKANEAHICPGGGEVGARVQPVGQQIPSAHCVLGAQRGHEAGLTLLANKLMLELLCEGERGGGERVPGGTAVRDKVGEGGASLGCKAGVAGLQRAEEKQEVRLGRWVRTRSRRALWPAWVLFSVRPREF